MHFALLTLLPIFTFTFGAPTDPTSDNKCSTGTIQCCNQVQKATDPSVVDFVKSMTSTMPSGDMLVGMDCSPVTMWGTGEGSSCTAEAVCCTDNSYGSMMSLGCMPIST